MRRNPSRPRTSVISRHCSVVRTSFQRSAGLITAPERSRNTELCIWPESPTARTSTAVGRRLRASMTSDTASFVERHHISGCCSDQPGGGGGARDGGWLLDVGLGQETAHLIHRDGLDRRGADVDADEGGFYVGQAALLVLQGCD